MIAIQFFVLCVLLFAGSADDPTEKWQAVPLTAQSSVPLDVSLSKMAGSAQCDGKGRLYFHTGLKYRDGVIIRIAKDGALATFSLPENQEFQFLTFEVSPEGKIWMLATGKKDAPYLFGIDPDNPGTPEKIHLDGPTELNAFTIQNFAVVGPKHQIVVQGYYDDKAPKDKQGYGYLALFASSGQLIKLDQETASTEMIQHASTWVPQANAPQTPDGTTYMLESNRILILSSSGTVRDEVKLKPADSTFQARQLFYNRGRLIVAFIRASQVGQKIDARYSLIDPTSGDILRSYAPSKEVDGSLLCFSDDGLEFLSVDQRHMKLVTAAIK